MRNYFNTKILYPLSKKHKKKEITHIEWNAIDLKKQIFRVYFTRTNNKNNSIVKNSFRNLSTMSQEQLIQKEQEKKIEKLSEQEQKEGIARDLEYQKNREILLTRIDKDKSLSFLKSLVERGLIEVSTAKQVLDNTGLDNTALAEIFGKLDEIESTHNVDEIFPKMYRISREEYLRALENPVSRIQTLTKIDTSLVFIHDSLNPNIGMGMLNFFSGFMHILDKNLIKIQEYTIGIKRSLT